MHLPNGTVRCCLCKGFVSISSNERFKDHMMNEHNSYFNTDFLFAACQLNSVNTTDFGIVTTIMQGMYEENIRSISEEEKGLVGGSNSASMNSMDSLGDVSTPIMINNANRPVFGCQDGLEGEKSREKKQMKTLPDYPDIPVHLIDEFERLCDKKDDSEDGFEPSLGISEGPGPCKMLNITKDKVKRSLSMKSFRNVFKDKLDKSIKNEKAEKNTFPCPQCDKTFHLSFLLKKHITSGHKEKNDKNQHPCPFCKKSFRFSILLRRHVVNKHKDNPSVGEDFNMGKDDLSCKICGKSYTLLGYLKRHEKSAHSNASMHNCDECGKVFNQSVNLKEHKQSHHKMEKEGNKTAVSESNRTGANDTRVFTESLV